MSRRETLEGLFERYVEHHVRHGEVLSLEDLCEGAPELLDSLRRRVARYHVLDEVLKGGSVRHEGPRRAEVQEIALPSFDGFETVERIGSGGSGEVYKVRDLRLGRFAAAKVLRSDSPLRTGFEEFLREARSLALFQDDRIVRIYEFRADADPPVLLMEYVDGFPLDRIGPSLEFPQRARVMKEVCEAVHRAHRLGIQHRDLKPANILLDQRLHPKILDFGLSQGDPGRGHLKGTPPYMAPEQLDPDRGIDARSDIYALGVVLYELLCGERPCAVVAGDDRLRSATTLRSGRGERPGTREAGDDPTRGEGRGRDPRLPVEIAPAVPEGLQAIALKAMEREPEDRYPSADEMARDLERYLAGRPVLARPTLYATLLEGRVRSQLAQIEEWRRLNLIYPHEASRLAEAYRPLESREEDWIVQSRLLSPSQIALYLGAFLLVCGALLYFVAHRFEEAVHGLLEPLLVLGLPFAGLNAAAMRLHRRDHKAVAVAFYLGGVLLLPLFLLILFHETSLLAAAPGSGEQFFDAADLSNRQLQAAVLAATGWAAWLALRTRTVGLSSATTFLADLLALAVLTDLGLEDWLEAGRWDLLALHLAPVVALEALAAGWLEERDRAWFARPLYLGGAVLGVAVVELLCLDGRAFRYLGISLAGLQRDRVADPVLLDTLAAMSLGGILFHGAGWLMERWGSRVMRHAALLLVSISPFAILEPLAWLSRTGDYSRAYDWLYLAVSLAVAFLSYHRQRKSFYMAGLLNTGAALWFVTDHNDWFDRPAWAILVIGAGLLALGSGLGLALRDRRRQRGPVG